MLQANESEIPLLHESNGVACGSALSLEVRMLKHENVHTVYGCLSIIEVTYFSQVFKISDILDAYRKKGVCCM